MNERIKYKENEDVYDICCAVFIYTDLSLIYSFWSKKINFDVQKLVYNKIMICGNW